MSPLLSPASAAAPKPWPLPPQRSRLSMSTEASESTMQQPPQEEPSALGAEEPLLQETQSSPVDEAATEEPKGEAEAEAAETPGTGKGVASPRSGSRSTTLSAEQDGSATSELSTLSSAAPPTVAQVELESAVEPAGGLHDALLRQPREGPKSSSQGAPAALSATEEEDVAPAEHPATRPAAPTTAAAAATPAVSGARGKWGGAAGAPPPRSGYDHYGAGNVSSTWRPDPLQVFVAGCGRGTFFPSRRGRPRSAKPTTRPDTSASLERLCSGEPVLSSAHRQRTPLRRSSPSDSPKESGGVPGSSPSGATESTGRRAGSWRVAGAGAPPPQRAPRGRELRRSGSANSLAYASLLERNVAELSVPRWHWPSSGANPSR